MIEQNQHIDTVADLAPSRREKFTKRVLPFIILAVVLIVIPMLGPSRTMLSLLNAIGINIVFALAYNILLGQTGLLSFGHAVYFGFGGYAAMHAMNWIENANGGFWGSYPMFALPIVGFAGGAFAGALIGWPSCRRAGIPFSMISLGIAELVAAAGLIFVSFFGGEEGISGDRMNGVEMFGLNLGQIHQVYWFIAFWTFVGTICMYAFTRTPLGKLTQAVRDNPQRVEFVGYDPQQVRYLAFITSGGFAGLAGGMAAVNYEIFTPEALSLAPSGLVLLMAYVGGIRYFAGPILGAILLTYMQSNLSDFSEAWLLYLGLLFITMVMFAPGGLAGLLADVTSRAGKPGATRQFVKSGLSVVTGFVAFIGVVIIVEIAVRLTNGFGEVFEPFGIALPSYSLMSWVIGIGLVTIGVLGLKFTTKQAGER